MKFTLSWLKTHLDTAASLQEIVDRDALQESEAVVPLAADLRSKSEAAYAASGGE